MSKKQKKFWYGIFIIVAIVCWSIDFTTKILAENYLQESYGYISIFFDIFRLKFTINRGGVFGIMQGNTTLFHILTGVGIVFLIYFFISQKPKTPYFFICMALIFGGALGNFTDRFFRDGVVDFIEMGIGNFYRYPYIYNMADVFIFSGTILLFIYMFILGKRVSRKSKNSKNSIKKKFSDEY